MTSQLFELRVRRRPQDLHPRPGLVLVGMICRPSTKTGDFGLWEPDPVLPKKGAVRPGLRSWGENPPTLLGVSDT